MPLSTTLTSVSFALSSKGMIANPTVLESQAASSVHVLAFTSHGELLVAESEGNFSLKDWESVCETAKAMCCGIPGTGGGQAVADDMKAGSMSLFLRSTLAERIETDLRWKD